jgi:hypothetical protein
MENWDANNTLGIADPRGDPDVGDYFRRLSGTGVPNTPSPLFWPTWSAQQLSGDLGQDEQRAAQKALVHASTQNVGHLDAGGPLIVSFANMKGQKSGGPVQTEAQSEMQFYDIQGRVLRVVDGNGTTV